MHFITISHKQRSLWTGEFVLKFFRRDMCVGISKEQGAVWAGDLGLGPCAAHGAWLRVQGGFSSGDWDWCFRVLVRQKLLDRERPVWSHLPFEQYENLWPQCCCNSWGKRSTECRNCERTFVCWLCLGVFLERLIGTIWLWSRMVSGQKTCVLSLAGC